MKNQHETAGETSNPCCSWHLILQCCFWRFGKIGSNLLLYVFSDQKILNTLRFLIFQVVSSIFPCFTPSFCGSMIPNCFLNWSTGQLDWTSTTISHSIKTIWGGAKALGITVGTQSIFGNSASFWPFWDGEWVHVTRNQWRSDKWPPNRG